MRDDLVTWLRAQLDADERGLNAWVESTEHMSGHTGMTPYEQLADIAAKRAIIDGDRLDGAALYAIEERGNWSEDLTNFADYVLRLLASAYADREGYQEGWKP